MLAYAPAKLNRFLAVIGKRNDGYHNLELITTVLEGKIELSDTIEAELATSTSLEIDGPQSNGLMANESNIVLRAWRLLELTAQRSLPANIKLYKRIPHGAGLGGGSSDAATTLKLGNELFNLSLPTSHLLTLGAQLGSDVPLFLLGGTVLGLDRGDRVFPMENIPLEPTILVYPKLSLATADVYKAIDGTKYLNSIPCSSLGRNTIPMWRNDLTDAALRICPTLNEVYRAILECDGEPLLCGSGSCWMARYVDSCSRNKAKKRMMNMYSDWQFWSIDN